MKYPDENTKKPQASGSNYGLSEAAGDKSILPASTRFSALSAFWRTVRAPIAGLRRYGEVFGRYGLDYLLPSHCLLCHAASKNNIVCPACAAELPVLAPTHCPHCLETTSYGERCGRCLAQPPFFDGVFATYAYAFPLDKLVQAYKYQQQLALAGWFAAQLADLLAPQQAEHDWTTLIPLPLHRRRLAERGFNQALEIARPLSKRLGIPCAANGLARIRAGAPQASLPLKERLHHLRGAFACPRDYRQQRVLLLDDVLTSGSTANECARVLKQRGAASVHVAVIARALRD